MPISAYPRGGQRKLTAKNKIKIDFVLAGKEIKRRAWVAVESQEKTLVTRGERYGLT
jgi:hypothetical protein